MEYGFDVVYLAFNKAAVDEMKKDACNSNGAATSSKSKVVFQTIHACARSSVCSAHGICGDCLNDFAAKKHIQKVLCATELRILTAGIKDYNPSAAAKRRITKVLCLACPPVCF